MRTRLGVCRTHACVRACVRMSAKSVCFSATDQRTCAMERMIVLVEKTKPFAPSSTKHLWTCPSLPLSLTSSLTVSASLELPGPMQVSEGDIAYNRTNDTINSLSITVIVVVKMEYDRFYLTSHERNQIRYDQRKSSEGNWNTVTLTD